MTDELQKNKSKWDINKVVIKGTSFGTGGHIIIPATWVGKTIVAMLKTKWDEMGKEREHEANENE